VRSLTGAKTRPYHRKEPTYRADEPAMPDHVANDPIASLRWRQIADRLLASRVLTEAHGEMLSLLCSTLADLERCRAEFAAGGYRQMLTEVYMTPAGEMAERTKANPLVSRIEKLSYQAARFLGEFGLTPMTAAKVAARDASNAEAINPFAAFLEDDVASKDAH